MSEYEQRENMTVEDLNSRNETWKIDIKEGRFWLRRFINGQLEESYYTMNSDEASISAVAIIQGYQPPRGLCRLDKLVGETQSEE